MPDFSKNINIVKFFDWFAKTIHNRVTIEFDIMRDNNLTDIYIDYNSVIADIKRKIDKMDTSIFVRSVIDVVELDEFLKKGIDELGFNFFMTAIKRIDPKNKYTPRHKQCPMK